MAEQITFEADPDLTAQFLPAAEQDLGKRVPFKSIIAIIIAYKNGSEPEQILPSIRDAQNIVRGIK